MKSESIENGLDELTRLSQQFKKHEHESTQREKCTELLNSVKKSLFQATSLQTRIQAFLTQSRQWQAETCSKFFAGTTTNLGTAAD